MKNYCLLFAIYLVAVSSCSVKNTESAGVNESATSEETAGSTSGIKFESVALPFAHDTTASTLVPRAVSESGSSAVAEEINKVILEHLMLESFDPTAAGDVYWSEMEFKNEEQDGVIWLSISATYYGAYATEGSKDFFFDANTGKEMEQTALPYTALFTLRGFHRFMSENWLNDCASSIKEANACAEMEPSCNCYDVSFQLKQEGIQFNLSGDCFPHVAITCEPDHSVTFGKENFEPHLSEFGKQLISADYGKGSKLDQFLFYRENQNQIPDYCFIKGLINDKYAFSMALSLNDSARAVAGSYYYDRHHQDIQLVGKYEDSKIIVDELNNGEVTGTFVFNWSGEYVSNGVMIDKGYITATWLKAGSTEAMPISLQAVLFNNDVNVYLGQR